MTATNPANPPAEMTWTTAGDGFLTTEHEDVPWALLRRRSVSDDRGRPGPIAWHLHRIYRADEKIDPEDFGGGIGTTPVDRGRWVASYRQLNRAKAIAAWLVTNPRLYNVAVITEAERLAFPDEGGRR